MKLFLNQSMLILIIYDKSNSMWCLVTFNKIFFFTSLKGGGFTSVNYLKMRGDYHWQKPNPHCSKSFAFK